MNDALEPTPPVPGPSHDLVAELRAIPLFRSLTGAALSCLEEAEEITFQTGDLVVSQGEPGTFFWVVLEGGLRLYQTMAGGYELDIATVEPGTALGEVALLANIPNAFNLSANRPTRLARFTEDGFWKLMAACPLVRKAILVNMSARFQKLQSAMTQSEKMASLGTLSAGLMHELKNPGTAAIRAAAQLRQSILGMHACAAKFKERTFDAIQKECLGRLQTVALAPTQTRHLSSLEESDAEEALVHWLESAGLTDAWKLAPPLVSIGLDPIELDCLRSKFPADIFRDALGWLEALASSMQMVTTIEESIGRIADLVRAVKLYSHEAKGRFQAIDINESLRATLVILGHKMREKQIALDKQFAHDLPPLYTTSSGLTQVWTNLIDNAIDAAPQGGSVTVRTWVEASPSSTLSISISDNGSGIPLEAQEHVFDAFYTTKEVGVGTGLGLGIVQRIVEQHGGSIRFSSLPGSTQFVIHLPAGSPRN